MNIKECNTKVQLRNPIHLNKKLQEKRIVTQIAAGKNYNQVTKQKKNIIVQILTKLYTTTLSY